MPSRKKSYRKRGSRKTTKRGSRKTTKRGSRKTTKRGSRKIKRSLRFTPKFVIKERADIIEDTLNLTRRRDTHRLPGDVANIIQGYEGGLNLYFNIDPAFQQYTFSTNTPLEGGERLSIKYPRENYEEGGPFYQFIVCELTILGFSPSDYDFYRYKVFLVTHVNYKNAIRTELEQYIKNKYRNVMDAAINDLIQRGYSVRTIYGRKRQISFEEVKFGMQEEKVFNAFEEPEQNKIIFEKLVQDTSGVYEEEDWS
jgi:hypothetical protein